MNKTNNEASLINRYFSFLRYVSNPDIFRRIINIFFFSKEGFTFHVMITYRLYKFYGLDGILKGLEVYSGDGYKKESLSGKSWYLNYQCNKEIYTSLIQQTESLSIFIPKEGAFPNQIKNTCLTIDNADYVVLVSADILLEPIALARIAQAGIKTNADLIYGDEINAVNGEDWEIIARPAFSLDLFLYNPCLGGVVAVKKSIYQKTYPQHNAIEPSAENLCELIKYCQTITHIPDILCKSHQNKKVDYESYSRSVTSYLNYKNINAVVTGHDNVGNDVRYKINNNWKATIIIPTKNHVEILKKCIHSIERTCDSNKYDLIIVDNGSNDKETLLYLDSLKKKNHTILPYDEEFNYSIINNMAVIESSEKSDFLVFMNNDIEVITSDWLIRLVENANRDDVGIVGPLHIFPDGRVQHAGIVLNFCGGIANHISKYDFAYLNDTQQTRNPGYNNYLTARRDYSAITGACMVMRKSVFKKLNGFNEDLRVGLGDIDLCLRATQLGLKILYDGGIVMIHHESYSRMKTKDYFHLEDNEIFKEKYADLLKVDDPWFNPILSAEHVLHSPATGLTSKLNINYRSIKLG